MFQCVFVGRAGERSYMQVSKGVWAFTGAQQVLHGKKAGWKFAVELLLLVFVAFKALAERKEPRN